MLCIHDYHKGYMEGCPPYQKLYCMKCRQIHPDIKWYFKKDGCAWVDCTYFSLDENDLLVEKIKC